MKWDRYTDSTGREWVRRVVEPSDRLAWARVPERLCAIVTEPLTTRPTTALELVQSLVAKKGLTLVLSSGPGRGKSVAAAWAVAHYPTTAGALWVDAPGLARVTHEAPDDEGVRHQSLDERMASVSLLVLDDVGLEHSPSGYAAGRICEVLTTRDADRVPTIVTTNLSAEQFGQRYGPRVVSRLAGDGLGFHALTGPDLRRQR